MNETWITEKREGNLQNVIMRTFSKWVMVDWVI